MQDLSKAELAYTDSLSLNPNDGLCLWGLAEALREQGPRRLVDAEMGYRTGAEACRKSFQSSPLALSRCLHGLGICLKHQVL
jgi:hypothetical protein